MKKYDIAAYIWPAYTGDEIRTRMFWAEGNGEWQSVKNAEENSREFKPEWYETWKQRKPLWGYLNEADPKVMEKKIKTLEDEKILEYDKNAFSDSGARLVYGRRIFLDDTNGKPVKMYGIVSQPY